MTNTATGLVDCGNWTQNASWAVPASAVSGIYFAKLVRTDGTAGRATCSSSCVTTTADPTCSSRPRTPPGRPTTPTAATASTAAHRPAAPTRSATTGPFTTRAQRARGLGVQRGVPDGAVPRVQRVRRQLQHGVDTDRRGAELLEHQAFLSVGHDEYWSGTQRANVEAARAAGVDLAFFSGNEIFWKTRWENSIDGSGTPHRTLVSYKETHANAKIDPLPNVWTGTWRDPRFSPPADGGRPENALSGRSSRSTAVRSTWWSGRPTARCASGATPGWRAWPRAPPRPSARTSSATSGTRTPTTATVPRAPSVCRRPPAAGTGSDHGSNYAQGQATHSMTMYKAPSGALVFGAGTIQWAWGLDGTHDRGSAAPDTAAQQATVNLLADMGAQPDTIRPGSHGGDRVHRRDRPDRHHHLSGGRRDAARGHARDRHRHRRRHRGGRVAGVEVSTDNGSTWRRATGRASWTYTFTPSVGRRPDPAGPCRRRQRQHRRRSDHQRHRRNPGGTLPLLDLARHRHPGPHRPGHRAGRGRGEVPRQPRRPRHRHPLLQARETSGTHVARCGPAPAPGSARSPSPTSRRAAGSRRPSRRPSRSRPARPTSPPTSPRPGTPSARLLRHPRRPRGGR